MELRAFIETHYPDLRSITGQGNRRLLEAVRQTFLPDMHVHEVPSGTQVLDWVVPPEWNCRSARLWDPAGNLVIDFALHNLHVLNYSAPFTGSISWAELEPHLHSLPAAPELIPYKTSYYHRTWGLCLADTVKQALPRNGLYRVEIDTTLNDAGTLTYGEWYLPGETDGQIFLSTHICHPRLAIDNLSSVAALAALGKQLAAGPRGKLGIRILLVPGTIGPVAWLARNPTFQQQAPAFAYVLALAGAPGPLHIKDPGPGPDTSLYLAHATANATNRPFTALPYEPYGYDERQYNTTGPAFGAVRIGRANYNGYPAYHTSADTPALLSDAGLADTIKYLQDLIVTCQATPRYTSLVPAGEPQYSRHGAFAALPALWQDKNQREQAMYWLMSQAKQSILQDISAKSNLPIDCLQTVAHMLVEKSLLKIE